MVKRMLAGLALLCALPATVHAAWFFNTQAKTAGGSITSRNMVNQTSTAGSIYKSYTTTAPMSVTVAANTGYTISNVTVNGVAVTNPASPYLATVQGPPDQSVTATFAPMPLSITAAASSGGSVSPASYSNYFYGSKLYTNLIFTFTPQAGYQLQSLTGAAGGTVNSVIPAATGQSVTVTYPAGTILTAPIALYGTFGSANPIASAGPAETVLVGSLVTLTGSYTGGSGTPPAYYTWTQIQGPAVALATSGNLATFTPTTIGDYVFRLTLDTGSSDTIKVTASNSATVVARAQCQNCHDGNGIGTPGMFQLWSSSFHRPNFIICTKCHTDINLAGHPGKADRNVCKNCHADPVTGLVPNHGDIGTQTCVPCHNQHSTVADLSTAPTVHFNNVTSAGYPASYMTSRSACTNCHFDDSTTTRFNAPSRVDWADSGHALGNGPGWASMDFKTMNGCVQCHTTTGFIAYSTGKVAAAWGTAADKTKELLTCIGCHSDVTNGTVRALAPLAPFADDSYLNRDIGKSNVCMRCHTGTNNGASIQAKVGTADFTAQPFIAPHYEAAGGTLHAVGGYHFPGRTYAFYTTNTHRTIGIGNRSNTGTSGPCVACHMSSANKHRFAAISSANGAVASVTATACANCHGPFMDAAKVSQEKGDFVNALNILKQMLALRGITATATAPYFSATNWGSGQDGANVMGAAFNYALLTSEQGAYAHNPQYAKQLLLDSIDYLDNGQFDSSAATLAVPNLRDTGVITQAAADSFAAYAAPRDSCTICHGGTGASPTPMASKAHPAHVTASYGPAGYLGFGVSACQACHTTYPSSHQNGSVDVANGPGSACAGCHAGVVPSFASGRLDCQSCHAATPAVLPNGVAAPYKGYFATDGHGRFPAANQCTACHDASSSHISGTLGTYKRLLLPDDNNLCASCHADPAVVPAFANVSSHVTKDGRTLTCLECHDPHGTPNLSMIRRSIKGSPIVFLNRDSDEIDPVSNLGLCQVCHTLTNHYRAGVPETNHFTSGCLNCHSHSSAGGAFRPAGSCDSCHGYPPAPKNVTLPFGFADNWPKARLEDYSGGGGAHLVAAHVSPAADPSQGWANCAVCHNGGVTGSTPNHRMVTPVKDHVDNVTVLVQPRLRFAGLRQTVYTSARLTPGANATGNCFNISCHMTQSPRWSTER